MDGTFFFIIIIGIIGLGIYLRVSKIVNHFRFSKFLKNSNRKLKYNTEVEEQESKKKFNYEDYYHHYQKRELLTKHEYFAWVKLREFAKKNNLVICAKVRLLDLIEPKYTPAKGRNYSLYKIQAKHVDFVICDQEMSVLAIIELDDNSHNEPDRMERDIFVNQVLKNTGYILIRARNITNRELALIASIIPGTQWSNQTAESTTETEYAQ